MELKSEQALIERWGGKTEPLLSVVCLAYNHASFIRKALESFLQQETDFPFEVIVHADASTDTTAAIIADSAPRYPSIIKPIYPPQNQFNLTLPISPRPLPTSGGTPH